MLDDLVLTKHKNKENSPEVSKKEDVFPTVGRDIGDMTAATSTKKKNNPSQKYNGGAPSGCISAMEVSTVSEKKSILKTNQT